MSDIGTVTVTITADARAATAGFRALAAAADRLRRAMTGRRVRQALQLHRSGVDRLPHGQVKHLRDQRRHLARGGAVQPAPKSRIPPVSLHAAGAAMDVAVRQLVPLDLFTRLEEPHGQLIRPWTMGPDAYELTFDNDRST